MLILGVDPGTATTGYSLIKLKEKDFEVVEFGLIETDKSDDKPLRYAKIYKAFIDLLFHKYVPDVMAIERVFFAANALTAINVGQAQGVMFLAAAHHNIPVIEYAPGTIKKVITGDGRAKKKQVEDAVIKLLGTSEGAKVHVDKKRRVTRTHIDNAVDAIAVALCHAVHLHDDTLKNHNIAISTSFVPRPVIIGNGKL